MPCHPEHNGIVPTLYCNKGYHQFLSEPERLGVSCHYDTIELSVLGHCFSSPLSSFHNTVDFIQYCISKSQYRWSCRAFRFCVKKGMPDIGCKIKLFIYDCTFYYIFLTTPTFWHLPCCGHVCWRTCHIFVIT